MPGPLKHRSFFCYGKMEGRCGCHVRRRGEEKLSFLKIQNWTHFLYWNPRSGGIRVVKCEEGGGWLRRFTDLI